MALRRRNVVLRTFPEPNLLWGALRPVRTLLALRQALPWKFCQVCSISVLYFGNLGTIRYEFSFPGAASDGPCFYEAGNVSTEAEVRHMRRRKQAVITRRLVPLGGHKPGPVDVGSHERSRVMLEQAFDDGNIEFKRGYLRFGSLWVPHFLNCLDHFAVDPAITPVRATGHQLVTLCRSVCAEDRAQILIPLMGSKSFPSSCAIKAHIQNEEGVGGKRSGWVFRDSGYRCSWQTESFLLSGLSKACLGVDAWPSWDLATLSGGEAFCPWPAIDAGNSWVAGFRFWGEPL